MCIRPGKCQHWDLNERILHKQDSYFAKRHSYWFWSYQKFNSFLIISCRFLNWFNVHVGQFSYINSEDKFVDKYDRPVRVGTKSTVKRLLFVNRDQPINIVDLRKIYIIFERVWILKVKFCKSLHIFRGNSLQKKNRKSKFYKMNQTDFKL